MTAPAPATPALATRNINKRFGQLVVARDISIFGAARRTLCADRSERRRQDDADQPDDRHDPARQRPDHARARHEITALKPDQRVKRGLVRTFQINTLFPNLSALEAR